MTTHNMKLGEGTINGIAWCVEARFDGDTLTSINARSWDDSDIDGFFDADPIEVWKAEI